MKKTRVIIVDDSALIRQMFSELLSSDPEIEVVATAHDPYDAREKIKQYNPDVITLDVEMPNMDGIAFLQKIMTLRPMPVVMVSTLTQRGAETTLRALELGAVDYISKPEGSQNSHTLSKLKQQLIDKVKAAAKARVRAPSVHNKSAAPGVLPFKPSRLAAGRLIAIGSSTGGVEALRDILVRLPTNTPPIVITQHMPERFTSSFAKRLDGLCQLTVHEAQDGQHIESGNVYLAPGGQHLEVKAGTSGWVCRLDNGPEVSGHRPSVDVLFNSVAKVVKAQALGVILTGMGKDGAQGMLAMRQAGAYTLGQDEESCVVYGMPKAAQTMGAVCEERGLMHIPEAIVRMCNEEWRK